MSISSLIVNKMNTEIILQETYKKLGIEVGQGERAFWNMEYRAGEGGVYGGRACTGFPNITRNLIVREDGRADLVVPKNIFISKHGLTSFLKYDPEISEQRDLLREMFEAAFAQTHSENLIFFFNVRKRKLVPNDSDCDVVMTVDYLHLWVMEKEKMHKQDSDFHQDAASADSDNRVTAVRETLRDFPAVLVPADDPCSFAPIHVKIETSYSSDVEQIVSGLFVCSGILKKWSVDPQLSLCLQRGVRLMIRREEKWRVHILGGGKLSSLSITVNR